jgi:crotonobetainyl-CoA:carnitine CoA-transferase CaiB-like acyl-CoA transferase
VQVRSVAPKLGEHNAEIFGRLGVSATELHELHAHWSFHKWRNAERIER